MASERVNISRREFLVRSAAAGGGLALGLSLPLGARAAGGGGMADISADEINAWVVIEPDDTVIVRIARSEMGQGTLTGLAQMAAEELACAWDKVTWEYASPRESVARGRP